MSDTAPNPKFSAYAHPGMLVTTEWLAEHLDDASVIPVESNEDPLLYDTGHIPGAVNLDWHLDLNHPLIRDYLGSDGFSSVMGSKGISPDSTLVFYGDNFNWWATYALWVVSLFGHRDVRILDGGRMKWEEEGRPLTTAPTQRTAVDYPAVDRDDSQIRAFLPLVLDHSKAGNPLVDVRSPEEFRGERLHMPGYPNEGATRGGHIPAANNVPWKRAANDDGTFKDADELRAIYESEIGLSAGDEVITYCRIGERSSHTWFVLTHLLGFENVRNYDGSWTEYGNTVGVPIEKP